MARTYDLTQGKVSKLILSFFFPMFFTNMLQQIYTIADTAIVGKGLGDNALAAVGNMSSLTFLVIGFSMGLANGFSVLIAQSFGAKDYKELRRAVASSIKLSLVIAVILTAASVIFLREILVLLQTSDIIIEDSLKYGYVIFGGLTATIAYNLCACILRALGDSKTPLIAIIASTIINIVLNCVSIFALDMGVEGPAAATIFSQLVSAFICCLKLRKIDILHLSKEDFRIDISMYLRLLKNGVPMAFMNSITAVGCMVVQYFVNGLGVAYTAAYSACSKYINLFMQPACTAGFTMSSFTSQNYGAKKYSRIREGLGVCLKIAFISYILLGSVMFFFPEILAKLMLNENDSIALAAQFLPICGVMLFGVDFLFVFRSGVQGMGFPFIPMCSGIVEMVMRIAVIVLFISELGFRATAYAEAVAWLGALVLNVSAFAVLLRRKLKPKDSADDISLKRLKAAIFNHS
ncbi:MAG: MATE family efflux transporter [Ruminococcus sp.]|nr:MATE family efflux transporter [Ruminococcus sp.]